MPSEATPVEEAQTSSKTETIRFKGAQKVAALFLILEKSLVKNIFLKLEDFEVQKISDAMFNLKKIPSSVTMEILGEFLVAAASGGLIATSNNDIKAFLTETLDPERASEILRSVKKSAITHLATYDAKTLANFLSNEHAQTIALIMCHLGSDKVSQVLKFFPEEVQTEVVMRMAYLEEISPEALNDIEDAIREAIKGFGSASKHKMGGVDYVADTLNRLDRRTTNSILDSIAKDNSELSETIKQKMFVFEDLIKIDPRGIQKILKHVDTLELTKALKVASEELREFIFSNMSQRASKMPKGDHEIMGPIKVIEVD